MLAARRLRRVLHRVHFRAIEEVGRGIVLMHDGSEDDGQRVLNKTGSMTMAPRSPPQGSRL